MTTTRCQEPEGVGRCPYCGSTSVAHAIALLETPGTRYSGSDWKCGYPHKFYLDAAEGHRKFYTRHLEFATAELVARFAVLAQRLLGVIVGVGPTGRVWYRAPRGWQTWGIVGEQRAEVPAADLRDLRFGPPIPQWVRDAPLTPPEGRS
jgi:hypothetical protein